MTAYRTRPHFSVRERLVDAAIGGVIGVVLGLAGSLVTIWLRFR